MNNRVGLGTFPLASPFKAISRETAIYNVRSFLDLGGYYIDTAPLYGFGEVERIIGEAVKGRPREQFYLITKCGYIDVEGKSFETIQKRATYDDVLSECDLSLKRLGLEYIDLYFVHSPDPVVPFEETMSALQKLQEQGKIKEIGVSNVNLEELKRYNATGLIRYVQNRFSMINRSIDPDFARYMLENNIKLVPYQVIDRGQLTAQVYHGVGNLRQEDLRLGRPDWDPEKVDVIAEWVKENLTPVADELGITIGQLSMAWALHQPYVGFIIVGLTSTELIPINLMANELKLAPEVLQRLEAAYTKLEADIRHKYAKSLREFRGLNEKYY